MRPTFGEVLISAVILASVTLEARTRVVRHPRPVTQPAYAEGGYASAASVAQGATLDLHVATSVSPFALQIVNLRSPDVVLQTLTLQSTARDCTGLSAHGCQWPVTAVLAVPASWPSGYYAARFPTSLGTRHIFFIVREDHAGSTSRMVVVASTHTFQAYNSFGGKSVYPSNSPERSHRVSFDRPYHDDRGLGRFNRWDKPFLDWLVKENRAFEVISDQDLEDPSMLGHYDVAVFVGHSEYWTATARAHLEDFIEHGGRVAIFGGNTMWWQARLEDRALVVHKTATTDPETGRNDAVVTVNWFAEPVLRPENLVTGVSFRNAGFTNRTAPTYGYTVVRATHWVFDGAGVSNGTMFGHLAAGVETDGALYNCTTLGPEVDGSDGTPLNFRILATVPAAEGHGTIGIYTRPSGGAVFNAGTQDWPIALATDRVVETMTRNVLNRFLAGRQPYEPVNSNVRMRELFNCPLDTTEEKIVPGWRGEEGELALTQRCAFEGPLGLELTGTPRILIRRGFAPEGNTRNYVELNFAIHADAATGPPPMVLNVVTLQAGSGRRVARVELQPSTKSVRLSLFNASNAVGLRSAFVPLAGGWNRVKVTWQSPGEATLRVNDGAAQTLVNTLANQTAGELLVAWDEPSLNGYVCMDALDLY